MTEKLKTLMDDAVRVDFATPDLDAIYRDGDRAVRRRRLTVGAAGLAAAVVTTAVVLTQGGNEAEVADAELATDVPMWTQGRTLHTPDRTYDLGVEVTTLGRTTAGVVYATRDGEVYTFDGRASMQVGEAAQSPFGALIADTDGTLAGWVEGKGDDKRFVVYDVETGERSTFEAHAEPARRGVRGMSMFLALDGSTAYWLDGGSTFVTDLASGKSRPISQGDGLTLVVAAENGLAVNWIEDEDGGDLGTDVVDADGEVLLSHADVGEVAVLSPDATWASGTELPAVWEVDTGQQVMLDLGGNPDGMGFDWLDDSTLMVVTEGEGEESLRLLTCQVPSGDCTEVTELDFGNGWVAVPSGGLMSMATFGSGQATATEEDAVAEEPSHTTSTERPE